MNKIQYIEARITDLEEKLTMEKSEVRKMTIKHEIRTWAEYKVKEELHLFHEWRILQMKQNIPYIPGSTTPVMPTHNYDCPIHDHNDSIFKKQNGITV
jgi:hypothetical protein